jgi:hypothetical protein
VIKMNFDKKGQGAIEYLLLLAAAIVVVAIVISFMSGAIGPTKTQGNRQLYESICNGPLTLDANSLLCGCYLKNPALGYGEKDNTGAWIDANVDTCPERLSDKQKGDPLLDWIP